MNAPVVVFAYRRPDHLASTLTSLMHCEGFQESAILVFCDGPRDESEREAVMATRERARAMLGDKAEYHYSENNLGLSRSVIAGVTETVKRFGRVIVIEDDLELNPGFLTFMNRALERYADEESVFQVSGFQFDEPELRDMNSALFLPFTVSWGWATWNRAWEQFDPMATGWEALRTNKILRCRFNLDGTYGYATMLVRQMEGFGDSWAVRWYWSVFKVNGLVLFPSVSLVSNTGFDGSGTHGRGLFRQFSVNTPVIAQLDIDWPEVVKLDAEQYVQVKKRLKMRNGGWIGQFIDKLRWLKVVYSSKQR